MDLLFKLSPNTEAFSESQAITASGMISELPQRSTPGRHTCTPQTSPEQFLATASQILILGMAYIPGFPRSIFARFALLGTSRMGPTPDRKYPSTSRRCSTNLCLCCPPLPQRYVVYVCMYVPKLHPAHLPGNDVIVVEGCRPGRPAPSTFDVDPSLDRTKVPRLPLSV